MTDEVYKKVSVDLDDFLASKCLEYDLTVLDLMELLSCELNNVIATLKEEIDEPDNFNLN